ncbi:MAG TPA: histidine phosphatase family protein [Vicinamibacterales bacterium]|nr:histidine phosphatase family protein [Vicinamibacterales bacterium]
MTTVLVHHAEAESPAVDPQRPLTPAGHAHADRLAAALHEAGFRPAAIWHSGKKRARQTAEAFVRLSPFADFRMVRGLRPDDPPHWMRHDLAAETRNILVVGHMPGIADLARALDPASAGVSLHGWLWLDRQADGSWREVSRSDRPAKG